MTAAAAPRNSQRKDSDRISVPVGASVQIWKETFVTTRGDIYAYPARSGHAATDAFLGVSYESQPSPSSTTAAAAAFSVLIRQLGTYVFAIASSSGLVPGQKMYALDDSTVTATATDNVFIGNMVSIVDATNVRVKIDLATDLAASTNVTAAARREVVMAAVAGGSNLNSQVDVMPYAGTLLSAAYYPAAAMTGDNTNSRAFTLVNLGPTNAGSTSMATLALPTATNPPANTAAAMTLSVTPANLVFAAGDVLQFQSVHTGTGIADPGGTLLLTYAPN